MIKKLLPTFIISVMTVLRVHPLLAQEAPQPVQDYQQNKFYETKQYSEDNVSRIQLADEQYKTEQFNEAMNLYQDVASDNPEADELHYNIGNSLFRLGKLPEAIEEYKKALKINPDDYDSKFNLEFALNQMKNQQQNQDQDEQEQQQQDQQQDQDEQEQQQQDQQQDQDEQEQQQQDQQQDQDEQEQQQQQQQSQPDDREMTQEEAEQILNALLNDEKDLQEQRKMEPQGNIKVLKDW